MARRERNDGIEEGRYSELGLSEVKLDAGFLGALKGNAFFVRVAVLASILERLGAVLVRSASRLLGSRLRMGRMRRQGWMRLTTMASWVLLTLSRI